MPQDFNTPSPNFDERKGKIDTLILHYTGMRTAQEAIARLSDRQSKVSCHYLIDTNGDMHHMVDENKRAWHAGVSSWRNRAGLNNYSIGIEIVNKGHEHGYEDFSDEQYARVINLCKALIRQYRIAGINIVGHSDVAPMRKDDPGEKFDWRRLAVAGVGLWVDSNKSNDIVMYKAGDEGGEIERLQFYLRFVGYDLDVTAKYDEATVKHVIAFQRHFDQQRFDGVWSERSNAILTKIVNTLKKTDV